MPMRSILLLILLLGGGGFAWMSFQSREQAAVAEAAPVVTMVKIFVAAAPLQAGTLLKDADFREQDIPADSVKDNDFRSDDNNRAEIRGAMVRRYLEAGQPILRPDILRPRDRGFLAAVLAPGTRAISVGVDATTGAAGLISPGDLVDVMLTQEFARGDTPIGRRVVAETVLEKVRVIAVDQQIAQGAPAGSNLPGAPPSRIASTVSLQVTSEQAAKISVAERLGRLTLIVRSIDGDQPSHPVGTAAVASNDVGTSARPDSQPASVFGSDVSAALSRDEPAASPRLRLIQGDAVNDVTFR